MPFVEQVEQAIFYLLFVLDMLARMVCNARCLSHLALASLSLSLSEYFFRLIGRKI